MSVNPFRIRCQAYLVQFTRSSCKCKGCNRTCHHRSKGRLWCLSIGILGIRRFRRRKCTLPCHFMVKIIRTSW